MRVPSPWTRTPLVSTQPTPPMDPVLAAPASQPALPSAASSQPVCAATAAAAAPQVWSAVRPWDLKPTTSARECSGWTAEALAAPVSGSAVSSSQKHVGLNSEVGMHTACAPDPHTERQATHRQAQTVGVDPQAATDEDMHEADDVLDNSSPAAGPPTGCLSLSCGEMQYSFELWASSYTLLLICVALLYLHADTVESKVTDRMSSCCRCYLYVDE